MADRKHSKKLVANISQVVYQAIKPGLDSNKNRLLGYKRCKFVQIPKIFWLTDQINSGSFSTVPTPDKGREKGEYEMRNMMPGID